MAEGQASLSDKPSGVLTNLPICPLDLRTKERFLVRLLASADSSITVAVLLLSVKCDFTEAGAFAILDHITATQLPSCLQV